MNPLPKQNPHCNQIRPVRISAIILATLMLLFSASRPAAATSLVVTNLTDSAPGSLRAVLLSANSAPDLVSVTFNIPGGGTINLAGALPILVNPNGISIDGSNGGNGAIIIDGGSSSDTTGDRILFLGVKGSDNTGAISTDSAIWSIANLTLRNGNARGGAGGNGSNDAYSGGGAGAGMGGAVFVNVGSATLSNVNLLNNRAVGGAGGGNVNTLTTGATGGGGGMGGRGGDGGLFNAGGGGGFGLTAIGGVGGGGNGAAGAWLSGNAAGAGSGTLGGAGGATGGGGGGSSGNQNGGGGGPSGLTDNTAAHGGFGGGGGGGGGNSSQHGGNGGYGGGGGGAGVGSGGFGGFGGGGGGGGSGAPAGFGAGAGGDNYGGGGGGAGLGGAVFVRQGATLLISDGSLNGSAVIAGLGGDGVTQPDGGAGQAIGAGLFLAGSVDYQITTGNTVTISDSIGGGVNALITGGFSKTGAGTLILAGTNTYTGTTTISGGSLLVNGSLGSGTAVTANSDGILGGTGSIGGSVSIQSTGHLAPGAAGPGILNTGDLALANGALARFEINGATAGTQYDQLHVSGSVALGASTLTLSGAYVATTGQSFVLIDNDGSDAVSSTFAGLAENATVLFNGVSMRISYAGGTGNDVVLSAPTLPDIAVVGNSVNINDGDTTPDTADSTDFGNVAAAGGTLLRTYTIVNSGAANLTLGAGAITINGANAADFTISGITLPATIPQGELTTFTVTFDPGAISLRTAEVSIANNDPDENPFNFTIQGTGTNSPPTLANPIPDQSATAATAFNFTFATNTFTDSDGGNVFTYSATLSDDTPLPAWLNFTQATSTFSGTPGNGDVGFVDIKVTATDNSSPPASVSDIFRITVNANTAGITVTPTSGLVTTEDGGTATFSVTLDRLPTANVNISLSSSTPGEGTVVAGITFTPADWNTPQIVTVTGIDDGAVDGDIAYSIVTAQATSGDPGYAAINPDDISVTNLDNECGVVGSALAAGPWKNISLSCFPAAATVGGVFGDDFSPSQYARRWVVYSFDPVAQAKVKLTLTSPLQQGRGYWIRSLDTVTWDIDGSSTPVNRSNAHCPSVRGCFEITLASPADAASIRRQLLGHPLDHSVPWANVMVEVGGTGGVAYTPDVAQTAGVLSSNIWTFNGSSYNTFTTGTGVLNAGEGFWVETRGGAFGQVVKLLIPR